MEKSLNQKAPKVSVVMSVYNSSNYLNEAIESVLKQSFTDFEFIVINDGSTDSSLSIIQSYSDNRIVLIDNDGNKGLIYSLNKGIEIAKGKYIARMDADDICLPERLKKQVDFLEENTNVGVLSTDYYSFNNLVSKYLKSIVGNIKIKTNLLFTATICHPSLMIRKSVIDNYSFKYSVEAKYVEDFDLWTRMALVTDFETISEALLKYRDHNSQVSRVFSDVQKNNSDIVRANYLNALNFNYNEHDLLIHNLISSNNKITSKKKLKEIEIWLSNLIKQNQVKSIFNSIDFDDVIAKVWFDCCGNTNIGLRAYFIFQFSYLKTKYQNATFLELKLLAKCLIRWIK